jgi:hypothetical protein
MTRGVVRGGAFVTALLLLPVLAQASTPEPVESAPDSSRHRILPLMGDLATKRGIELPLPLGAGLVFYHLDRSIRIDDVRVGSNGATPQSVSEFAQLSANAVVNNLNFKLDAWILPFVNVYAIVGYIWNQSETTIDVTLPPLTPSGPTRRKRMTVPTEMEGTVGGLGITVAGGYGPFFMTFDSNGAQADLGFDDRFKAVVTSFRGGWNGKAGGRPLRAWANVTDWNTDATASGTVPDPDGGSLSFEVDQGPAYEWTYGVGAQYVASRHIELATDTGFDGHGGWYLALVPVYRF